MDIPPGGTLCQRLSHSTDGVFVYWSRDRRDKNVVTSTAKEWLCMAPMVMNFQIERFGSCSFAADLRICKKHTYVKSISLSRFLFVFLTVTYFFTGHDRDITWLKITGTLGKEETVQKCITRDEKKAALRLK